MAGEDLYYLVLGISLLMTWISWFSFARISMARIEKGIVSEGKPRPCPWDGVGGRVVWYAWTVALPADFFNDLDNRMLNTADVKRYVTPKDQVIAWMLMIFGHVMVFSVLVGWFFEYY